MMCVSAKWNRARNTSTRPETRMKNHDHVSKFCFGRRLRAPVPAATRAGGGDEATVTATSRR
jgi:hypothetical protein